MPQGWPDNTERLMGADQYEKVGAASNNADTIKASPGVVTGYYVVNIDTIFNYVKLYNKASNPAPATDTPVWVIGVPPASAANVHFVHPLAFSLGIAVAMVQGLANNNNTSILANVVVASIAFI